MARNGLVVVISAPSGTGKGTLLKHLADINKNVRHSVSVTTRSPREGEIEGINYFFRTADEFKKMIENNELVEWDQYCENYYGTPRAYIDQSVEAGFDIFLEITVEGAINIRKQFPDCVLVFILPPSFEELKKRIIARGTEEASVIEKRLYQASKEITYVDRYDYIVVNDDIDRAVRDINIILMAEKLKCNRNKDILKELGL